MRKSAQKPKVARFSKKSRNFKFAKFDISPPDPPTLWGDGQTLWKDFKTEITQIGWFLTEIKRGQDLYGKIAKKRDFRTYLGVGGSHPGKRASISLQTPKETG